MLTYEKIFLTLMIIIVLLLLLNLYRFMKKNSEIFKNMKKTKNIYSAKVVDKRHYIENNRNLFYVKFCYDDNESEFLVNEAIYNQIFINQEGTLTLKYDYFFDFK